MPIMLYRFLLLLTLLFSLSACGEQPLPLDVLSTEPRTLGDGYFAMRVPDRWVYPREPVGFIKIMCSVADECFRRDFTSTLMILEQDFSGIGLRDLVGDSDEVDEYVLHENSDLDLYVRSNIKSMSLVDAVVTEQERLTNSQGVQVERMVVSATDSYTMHRLIYFDSERQIGFTASFIFTDGDGTEFQQQIDGAFDSFVIVEE